MYNNYAIVVRLVAKQIGEFAWLIIIFKYIKWMPARQQMTWKFACSGRTLFSKQINATVGGAASYC